MHTVLEVSVGFLTRGMCHVTRESTRGHSACGASLCVPARAGWRPEVLSCPGLVLPVVLTLREGEHCSVLKGPCRVFSVNCLFQPFARFPRRASFVSMVLTPWVVAALPPQPPAALTAPRSHSAGRRSQPLSWAAQWGVTTSVLVASSSWRFSQSQRSPEVAVWPLRTGPRPRCRGFTEGFRPPGGSATGAVSAADC